MTELFWMGFAAGVLLGGFLGLVLAGLLRMSSDLELRMAHHVRNSDEHEDLKLDDHDPYRVIELTPTEIQSGLSRVRWAELLIKQLPKNHDGRNSWLLNYGTDEHEDLIKPESRKFTIVIYADDDKRAYNGWANYVGVGGEEVIKVREVIE